VVAACDHGLGHTLPGDYRDVLAPWVVDHVFGEPSPYADDLPGFPSYCSSATAR